MIFRRLSMTLLAAAAAIAASPASAICQNASCGCTELGVDAVYWRPFGAGLFLGELVDTPTEGPETRGCQYARADHQWGVRAYGRYFIPSSCLFVAAEYSWFQPEDSLQIGPLTEGQLFSGPSLLMTEGSVFEAKNRFTHHAFDVVAGYCLCCNPCACLSVAGGVQYLNLQDQLAGTALLGAEAVEQSLKEHAEFSGAGPLVRWDVRGSVFGCVDIRIAALAGGLIGNRSFHSQSTISSDESSIIDTVRSQQDTAFIPVLGTELSLGYQVNLCGICWGIEGGYRHRGYFQALNADLCDENLQTINIAGPYVGLNATF